MLISHRKKFIYTKTKKTASTSVEVYFAPYCLPENQELPPRFGKGGYSEYIGESGIIGIRNRKKWGNESTFYNHMSAQAIKENIKDQAWSSYLKFCTVRNPFDRLISAFFFREKIIRRKVKAGESFNRWNSAYLKAVEGSSKMEERFQVWLEMGGGKRVNDRDKYSIDGEIVVDFFVRYESLHDDLQKLCEMLDIPYHRDSLQFLKSKSRPDETPFERFYNQRNIQIVSETYKFELDHFGYELPV